MKTIIKYIILLCVGGVLYACCELIFRGYTFKTMAFVGGVCFVLCGLVNEFIDWKTPLPLQMLICAVIVTTVEFVAGVILNIGLGLNMWDCAAMNANGICKRHIEACEGRETCKSRNSCGECKNYMIPKGQEPCKSCKNVRG